MGELADQGLVAGGVAKAAHHCRDLGVEQGCRNRTRQVEENFDVLPRRVKHLQRALGRHQRQERRQVDPGRQRVDRGGFLGAGDLHQTQDRPISALAHKLGVDRDKIGALLPCAKFRQQWFSVMTVIAEAIPRKRPCESVRRDRIVARGRANWRAAIDRAAAAGGSIRWGWSRARECCCSRGVNRASVGPSPRRIGGRRPAASIDAASERV